MFGDYISQDERQAALALRIEAARFERNGPPPQEGALRELDAFLADAPDWLIGAAALAAFRTYGGPRINDGFRQQCADIAAGLGVGYMEYAASRTGFRTVLRMRADRLSDPAAALSALQGFKDMMDAEQASSSAYGRRYLGEVRSRWKRGGFTLAHAFGRRGDEIRKAAPATPAAPAGEGAPPPLSGLDADMGGGFTVRPVSEKEARAISKEWADGWELMSPANAVAGRVGPMVMRDKAVNMARAGMMAGIFAADGTPAGSVSVSPVSATEAVIGWHVASEFRGRGLATRSVAAVAGALEANGFRKLAASCMVSNAASMRVAEKLGFSSPDGEVRMGTDVDWTSMTADVADVARPLAAGPAPA